MLTIMRISCGLTFHKMRAQLLPAALIGVLAMTVAYCAPQAPADAARNMPGESRDTIGLNAAEPDRPNTQHYDGGPILIELFTSQGCSSCPPADRVLSLLRQTGQVDGIPLVVLSEHVDYWNRLGWKDPYSSSQFSDRQAAYARAINRSNRIYTPQMVVDGSEEFVGHNLRRATEAVRRAATRERIPLQLDITRETDAMYNARLTLRGAAAGNDASQSDAARLRERLSGADVLFAVTEDGLADRVGRGENAGHTLRHDGVVRRLFRDEPLSASDGSRVFSLRLGTDSQGSEWKRENLRLVAWLEDRETRAVLGAAVAAVPAQ